MEKIIFSTIDYMMGFIEIVLYDGFMCARFEKVKSHQEKKRWMMYIVGSIGIYSANLLSIPMPLGLIIHMFVLIGIGHYRFKKNLAEELTFTLFYLGIIFLVDLFVITTLGSNKITANELMGSGTTYLYVRLSIISKLLLIGIVRGFVHLEINKKKEYEVIEYQNEVLIKATLEKDEMNKEVRKIWHDFNNHISCIDMLLQMNNIEKARGYIKNMNASCQTTYMGIKTGNELADVVINQKYMLAKAQDISLKVSGQLDESLSISQMDLCALLCNSLDNAIEACREIEDITIRKIDLFLEVYKNYLHIDINNSVKKEAMDNNKLITTKQDKSRHGIGMLSMKTIVEKYGGHLEWKYDHDQFCLSIVLKDAIT